MNVIEELQTIKKEKDKEVDEWREQARQRMLSCINEVFSEKRQYGNKFFFDSAPRRGFNAQKIKCPFCLGLKRMPVKTDDILAGFIKETTCSECEGKGYGYICYGWRAEISEWELGD